jgi:two-component system OmpR family response regulator
MSSVSARQSDPLRRPDGSPARLLVVDDEEALVDLLGDALRFAGYDVVVARAGFEALRMVGEAAPDLLVLDVNLPDIDGFEVCRRLRRDGDDVPVIFLTARDDPSDLRTGFTRGGDDYLTKPFSLEELRFRIEAILRRSLRRADQGERLACDDVEMDVDAHRVWRAGREVTLSATEFRLLRYLLLNAGRVLSKAQILDHVWQYDFDGDGQVVETYISYLRRKLDDRAERRLIHTVRGVGYTIRPRGA